MVVEPSLVKKPLVVGGVLTGSFWLSGRLHGFSGSRDGRDGV